MTTAPPTTDRTTPDPTTRGVRADVRVDAPADPPVDAPTHTSADATAELVPTIGELAPRFDGVERIAVLRGGGLGDLLFAMPAIDALAAAYPGARITLLGNPLHRALLEGRPSSVSDVELLPVAHGVRDGAGLAEDPAATEEFVERLRARGFDLAVQVHGGGRNSNPFLLRAGARHTVGTQTPDAVALERVVPFRYYQHEMLRFLEVVGLAGARPVRLEPVLAVTEAERERGAGFRPADGAPLLVIHPGATDPRRRWPVGSFAELAGRVVSDGGHVVVVGEGADAGLADEIVAGARALVDDARREHVRSLGGQLSLSDLVALLAVADAFAGNDSGPRHLALAVGCPTVGVFWFGNVINAGPLGRTRDRVHMSWTTRCPVCDAPQVAATDERCEHDVSFVAEVTVDEMHEEVADLLVRAHR